MPLDSLSFCYPSHHKQKVPNRVVSGEVTFYNLVDVSDRVRLSVWTDCLSHRHDYRTAHLTFLVRLFVSPDWLPVERE